MGPVSLDTGPNLDPLFSISTCSNSKQYIMLQKYLNIKEYCSIMSNVTLHIQTIWHLLEKSGLRNTIFTTSHYNCDMAEYDWWKKKMVGLYERDS